MHNWQIEKLKKQRDILPAMIFIRLTSPDMMKDIDNSKLISVRKA